MPAENLTIAKLDKYRVEKGRMIVTDTMQPGLAIRVSHTGLKTWQVQYRVHGSPTKQVHDLGTYPRMSLSEARAAAAQIKAEALTGRDPKGKMRELEAAPTFEALAEDYLRLHARVKKRSWAEDERVIHKTLLPAWGSRKAVEITRRDVIALLDDIASRTPIQANRTLALVRKIYNWGIGRSIIETNPCYRVEAPGVETQRDRVLTPDEIRALWRALCSLNGFPALTLRMRLITAQRGGEVEAMRWQDLDLDAGWWTIPAEVAKNGLSHRVPLNGMARELLRSIHLLSGGQEWVFPGSKGNHTSSIQKAASRATEKAIAILNEGREEPLDKLDWVPHDLRRTAATQMASLGVPRATISKVLNHVETGVTAIYDRHSYDAEKRDALEKWGHRLSQIVEDRPRTERRLRVL